jgi:fructosamine-3-kinase
MFDGESDSLKAIAATHTVHVPKPLHVLDNPEGGAVLVLEYLDMKGLTRYSRQLGEELARMHLHNEALGKKQKEQECYVGGQGTENKDEDENKPVYMSQFGFHTTTCCGYLPQDNTFCDDWPVSIFLLIPGSCKVICG